MNAAPIQRALHTSVALLLVVSLTACSTTKVTVRSPQLAELNRHAQSTKSVVTLRDGRQLEVQGLQVGAEDARGELRRERAAPVGGREARWAKVPVEAKELMVASREIATVWLRSGRQKGGWLGALAGLLVGGGAGIGIGYAATTEDPCGPYSTECYPGLEKAAGSLVGLVVGGVVGALTGALIGSRGVERTYVFEEIAPMPSPEPAPAP